MFHLVTKTYENFSPFRAGAKAPCQSFCGKLNAAPFGEPFVEQRKDWGTDYKFTSKELDSETGLYYFGARYYSSDLSVWLSVDPLSDKYPSLSPYNYCANNPIKYVDPDGREIEPVLEKGAGANGNDRLTLKVTGKIINFSNNKIDMESTLKLIENEIISTYSGIASDGTEILVEMNFSVAQNMNEVNSTDHLIVLAKAKDVWCSGGVNEMGGRVMVLDADYFSGWYDTRLGREGKRSAAHEFGHWLGLDHKSGKSSRDNIMTQGLAMFRGNNLNQTQLNKISGLKNNKQKINYGLSYNTSSGLPNMGNKGLDSKFELKNTKGREKQWWKK